MHVVGHHWHAVQRDLRTLGLRGDDIGTPKLTLWEFVSYVMASPPGSAVHFATGGWDKASEMLANLSEQHAGLIDVNARYQRPGIVNPPVKATGMLAGLPDYKGISLEPLAVDEFTRRLRERQEATRKAIEDT